MSKSVGRTINLAAELRSGRHHCVFIDDTGSPGLVTPGLRSRRKSWVAVIVSPPVDYRRNESNEAVFAGYYPQ
jgi:hypothetical protein